MSKFRRKIFRIYDSGSFVPFLVTMAAVPVVYFGFRILSSKFSKVDDKGDTFYLVLVVIAVLLSLIPSLIRFLNNDSTKRDSFEARITAYDISEANKDLSKTITREFNKLLQRSPDLLKVENIVYEKVEKNLEESILSKLEKKFRENLEDEYLVNQVDEILIPITKNTKVYIDRIQRNSIVNLVIGIIGTITAILILAFSILYDKSFVALQDFLMHFVPRFTFVVFIQLFAFFFLRLYKNNLEDAKYFQNELSNLTAKSVSLKISLLTKNMDTTKEILKNISNTERNFKLLKDETLHNLENKKLEKELDENVLNQLRDLISKIEIKK